MPFTVGYGAPGVGGLSHRRSRTIVGTKLNNNVNQTNQKQRGKGLGRTWRCKDRVRGKIRTSIRKEGSPMDWQYFTGRGEWRQWETTVSYGPMLYQVRLKPNYGERG